MTTDRINGAAKLIAEARRSGTKRAPLPVELQPKTVDEGHAIQDAMVALLKETVGGWKTEQGRSYFSLGGSYPLTSQLTIDGAYMNIQTPGRRGRTDERVSRSITAPIFLRWVSCSTRCSPAANRSRVARRPTPSPRF